jgi:hypothetical protein
MGVGDHDPNRREDVVMGAYHQQRQERADGSSLRVTEFLRSLPSTVRVPRRRRGDVARFWATTVLVLLSAQAAHPLPARGQTAEHRPPITMLPVDPSVGRAGASGPLYERRVALIGDALVTGVSATTREDSLASFILAVDTARALVQAAPGDADAHYLYAVALGQRLELSGTREKVRLGAATRAEAETALALNPDHPGAHHVLGRLHAGTMRMNPVARFLARRVLGAEALEGASWERAEYHFVRAHELEPDNPRHSVELGVLYLDTDRPDEALAILQLAAAAPHPTPIDTRLVQRAVRLIGTIEGN